MLIENLDDIEILRFENLSGYSQITQFISTRKGGVSKPPFDTLNISFKEEDFTAVLENHKRLAHAVNVPIDNFVFCRQIHSGNVVVVTGQQRGAGVYERSTAILDADAMITNEANLCLSVLAADCVPILLYDPVKNAVGAVHSGRKGTVVKILTNTVELMKKEFGTNPLDLVVGIGPSIGPESYEVDTPVIEAFATAFPGNNFIQMKDKTHGMLNLWEANKFLLLTAGVQDHNIEIAGIDTYTNTDRFFSERKDGLTGRFVAGIMLH
ncbi:MAG: hypothetical protein G01um10145_108 [Microgenomates group bacterium Gr01-1014_5]|nr:MAG: hypothetical protein G01um10145_108 [Microgenomates group bacterium Gr01-1014_5]